jgi:hypothetical protein
MDIIMIGSIIHSSRKHQCMMMIMMIIIVVVARLAMKITAVMNYCYSMTAARKHVNGDFGWLSSSL